MFSRNGRYALAGMLSLSGLVGLAWAQTSFPVVDLVPLDGSFVGPVPRADSGVGIAMAFATLNDQSAFAYGGPNPLAATSFGIGPGITLQSSIFFVNASGEVSGQDGSGFGSHAFVYANGNTSTIPAVGSNGSFGTGSTVTAMSSNGYVVGYRDTPGDASSEAFLFDPSTATTVRIIDTLGSKQSVATAVSSSGVVVGYANVTGDAGQHAFVFQNGQMTDLGTFNFGTNSSAIAISSGTPWYVVGQSTEGLSPTQLNVTTHAFVSTNGGPIVDIGTVTGGSSSNAVAVNAYGEVIGTSKIPNGDGTYSTHSYYFQANQSTAAPVDIGTLGGANTFATAININGDIVGSSQTANNETHSFLYHTSTQRMVDLSAALKGSYSNVTVYGINIAGQVIASATDDSGVVHAILILAGS